MNAILYIALAMAVIAGGAWLMWPRIQHWFRDSETLFWARLQMFIGAAWALLLTTPLAPFLAISDIDAKWIAFVVAIQGLITEIARRNRATDL